VAAASSTPDHAAAEGCGHADDGNAEHVQSCSYGGQRTGGGEHADTDELQDVEQHGRAV
jgi:hypothetical protein